MKRSIVFAGIAGLVIACSSTAGGPPVQANAAAVTLASAPSDFSNATCNKLDSCAPQATSMLYGSLATCKERSAITIKNALNAPGVSVTSAQLSDCFAAYQSMTCDETILAAAVSLSSGASLGPGSQPKACDFRGTLADGAACGTDAQCISGSCFEFGTATPGCGTCTPRAVLGGSCAFAHCENGLWCSYDSSGRPACAAAAKLGDTCHESKECEGRAVCVGGKCGAPLAENADCETTGGCDTVALLECVPSDAPGATGRKCTKYTVNTAGQDCGILNKRFVACGSANYCDGYQGSAPGKCTASPKEPEDCTSACLSPARCNQTTKKCEIRDPANCK